MTTLTKKLDPNYAYSRPELKKVARLYLMFYLEGRYKVPRAKSEAPPNYEGPFTALIKDPGVLIELIWEKYMEEGIAGAKQLKKDAPREPDDGNSDRDNSDRDDPTDDSNSQEGEETAYSEEAPHEVERPKPHIRVKPVGQKEDIPPDLLEAIRNIVQEELEGALAPVHEMLKFASGERQAIHSGTEALAIDFNRMFIGMRSILLMTGTLAADINGLDLGIGEENVETHFNLGWESLNVDKLVDAEEPPKELKKRAARGKEKEAKEEEPTVISYDNGTTFDVVIDGESYKVSMLALQSEKKFPSTLLAKLGTELGLEVRGVPRVKAIPLIWDEIITQCTR